MGPWNSGDFDFSLCKARVYALALQGHFYGQSPAKSPGQIPAGKCEITLAGLGMESSPAVP